MTAKVLMVQGTSSSAGKSLLVTALCHSFARRGVRVAPFKAQNMSNNAAVCPDGAEIGRAQAVQAAAAGVEPTADMNPVLIKPEADARSQIVLLGRPWHTLKAKQYYQQKAILWGEITAALDRLRAKYELVLVEGAGSPAELNLRAGDIVNMAVARYAQAPVLLVGDIDRGGIFAQLLGTLWLLPPEERALVRGLVANKFRGDITLFTEGVRILEERSGIPVLGVIPYLHNLHIPEEDAVALEGPETAQLSRVSAVDIVVIRLPRIANFDDFDPLIAEPGVRVRYVDIPQKLGNPQAIILPGTKSTVADLDWLRTQGLAEAIQQQAQRGAAIVGICGGYQMLGRIIRDPDHIEAKADLTPGLGLLPTETIFVRSKATFRARGHIQNGPGWLAALEGQKVEGYEIHMGHTQEETGWLEITNRNDQSVRVLDGAASADGRIWGCYLHGVFANTNFRRAWLSSLGWQGNQEEELTEDTPFTEALTRLTDAVEAALDMKRLEAIVWDN
jgi:adenosylcobyric acid synthase